MQYDENAEKYGYEGEMTPMKCDELKSLWVYNRDINENCDEEFVNFAKENGYENGYEDGYEELVEKKEVDAAIAELKEAIATLRGANEEKTERIIELQKQADELDATIEKLDGVKKSAERILQNLLDCGLIKEWYFNGKFNVVLKADDPHLKIAELKAENERLKNEKKKMYTKLQHDTIIDAMSRSHHKELRATKRALWLARAERAKECKYKYETWERHEERKVYKDYDMIAIVSRKARMWLKVERKCRAKAEQYK